MLLFTYDGAPGYGRTEGAIGENFIDGCERMLLFPYDEALAANLFSSECEQMLFFIYDDGCFDGCERILLFTDDEAPDASNGTPSCERSVLFTYSEAPGWIEGCRIFFDGCEGMLLFGEDGGTARKKKGSEGERVL